MHYHIVSQRSLRIAQAAMLHRAWQKEEELAHLVELVLERQPRVVVEVGAGEGGTFYALAQAAHPEALMVSIDMGREKSTLPCAEPAVLLGMTQPDQRFEYVIGDSQAEESRIALEGILDGEKIDVLFLDADHRLAGVTRDHDLYAPLVRAGGLVVFHDILPQPPDPRGGMWDIEVAPLWERVKGTQFWEFVAEPDYYGGIGAYEK